MSYPSVTTLCSYTVTPNYTLTVREKANPLPSDNIAVNNGGGYNITNNNSTCNNPKIRVFAFYDPNHGLVPSFSKAFIAFKIDYIFASDINPQQMYAGATENFTF